MTINEITKGRLIDENNQLKIENAQLKQRVIDLETELNRVLTGNAEGTQVFLEGVPEYYRRAIQNDLKK